MSITWMAGLAMSSNSIAFEAGHQRGDNSVRTLWMSDLTRPVGDPDDYYDLAVGISAGILGTDQSMVVVDELPGKRPARAAVKALARIANVPKPPVVRQRSLGSQIRFLRESSPRSVEIVTLGSLTGLSALLKSSPKLVASRVRWVTIFAGDAAVDAPIEANVSRDPRAFVKVMKSGLRIRWVPCFDGGLWSAGSSSYVYTTDEYLLRDLRPKVRKWFEKFVGHRFGGRNLWAAGLLVPGQVSGSFWEEGTFDFNEEGVLVGEESRRSSVTKFTVRNRKAYEYWMIESTRIALAGI